MFWQLSSSLMQLTQLRPSLLLTSPFLWRDPSTGPLLPSLALLQPGAHRPEGATFHQQDYKHHTLSAAQRSTAAPTRVAGARRTRAASVDTIMTDRSSMMILDDVVHPAYDQQEDDELPHEPQKRARAIRPRSQSFNHSTTARMGRPEREAVERNELGQATKGLPSKMSLSGLSAFGGSQSPRGAPHTARAANDDFKHNLREEDNRQHTDYTTPAPPYMKIGLSDLSKLERQVTPRR